MSNLEEEEIPKSIKIAKYTYSFKEKEIIIDMYIDVELENVVF